MHIQGSHRGPSARRGRFHADGTSIPRRRATFTRLRHAARRCGHRPCASPPKRTGEQTFILPLQRLLRGHQAPEHPRTLTRPRPSARILTAVHRRSPKRRTGRGTGGEARRTTTRPYPMGVRTCLAFVFNIHIHPVRPGARRSVGDQIANKLPARAQLHDRRRDSRATGANPSPHPSPNSSPNPPNRQLAPRRQPATPAHQTRPGRRHPPAIHPRQATVGITSRTLESILIDGHFFNRQDSRPCQPSRRPHAGTPLNLKPVTRFPPPGGTTRSKYAHPSTRNHPGDAHHTGNIP